MKSRNIVIAVDADFIGYNRTRKLAKKNSILVDLKRIYNKEKVQRK